MVQATIQATKKMLRLGLMVCSAAMLIAASTVDGAQVSQTNKVLQPQGLNHVGVYALRQMEPDLTGSGVKFAVISRSITYIDGEPQNDYRPGIGHNCFKTKQFGFHDLDEMSSGISPHSTAICSILFGEDPDAFNPQLGQFYYQGVAPQAQADVYEFWYFLIDNVFAQNPPNADILTASVGSQFEDWWTRGIESLAEHHGLIVVSGIGNGADAYDPPLYPGAAANVIGVGVVDSVNTEDPAVNLAQFSLAYPEHSSFGPTEDGRCKPDIVAPGNCLAANADEPNSYEMAGNWSSFSTPVVAGAVGLLVQKAKQEPDLSLAVSSEGGNCVMKAVLLNSANKLPYWHKGRLQTDDDHAVPLDYIQGAGMLNTVGAYKQLTAGQDKPGDVSTTGWDLNKLQKNEDSRNTYKITLTSPADKVITATVVWNRHYSKVYPFESLLAEDSNLRLEIWAVDSNNSNNNYLLDYSDSEVDNVEHIYCRADPNYANYEIVVSCSDTDYQTDMDAAEQYSLAWNISESRDSDSIFWHDLNSDGVVNELDFVILLGNWTASLKSSQNYLLGDMNTDGTIDANDLQILLEHKNRRADWHAK